MIHVRHSPNSGHSIAASAGEAHHADTELNEQPSRSPAARGYRSAAWPPEPLHGGALMILAALLRRWRRSLQSKGLHGVSPWRPCVVSCCVVSRTQPSQAMPRWPELPDLWTLTRVAGRWS